MHRSLRMLAGATAISCSLGLSMAASNYAHQSNVRCAGGLGWIGPGLATLGMLALVLPLLAATVVVAGTVAIRGRRWRWLVAFCVMTSVGVFAFTGLGVHLAAFAYDQVIGLGCSGFFPYAVYFTGLLPATLTTLAFALFNGRNERAVRPSGQSSSVGS